MNRGLTAFFDTILAPLEFMGRAGALVFVSAVFGVLALVAFKRLSWQRGIKAAKNKIKAHLIEIRIYQDDLALVTRAIGKVLGRNFQYLGLNLLPFALLAIPMVPIVAQLVVHYGFDPLPLTSEPETVIPGRGTMIEVQLARADAPRIKELSIRYPDGITKISPLVRVPSEGRAFQEVVATKSGKHTIELQLGNGVHTTKTLWAGDERPPAMQPERGASFASALLWPAEPSFESGSPFERVSFAYPDAKLGWFSGGAGNVLLIFFVASFAAAVAVIKPLKIQI